MRSAPSVVIGLALGGAIALAGGSARSGGDDGMTSPGGAATAPVDSNRPAIDRRVPGHLETATFALGWFWTPDSRFGSLDGVVRTRVGYCGGKKEKPTYHDMGDHTETFEVDFDPSRISYERLLAIFWQENHDPTAEAHSVQYKSAIFAANDEQERLARASRDALARKLGQRVTTEVLRGWRFWLAEDYHQKYALQGRRELAAELRAVYPRMKDFVDSTAAARLNGWLHGHGDPEVFEKEIGEVGLTQGAQEAVRKRMGRPANKSCGK